MSDPAARIRFLSNALVAPLTKFHLAQAGEHGYFDGGVYDHSGGIVEEALQTKLCYQNIPAQVPPDAEQYSSGSHLFAGMMQTGHFGHFMVESLGRLWAAAKLGAIESVVFTARSPGAACPPFAAEMLRLLGVDTRIQVLATPTRFEHMAVPVQLARRDSGIIWGFPENLAMTRPLRDIAPAPFKSVYVSRSRLKVTDGGFVLESMLEHNLAEQGYEVIHPQEMTLAEQFAIYNGAERIIFAEGSAIHVYALVARADQRAYTIWRRKAGNIFNAQVQSFGGPPLQGAACVLELWVPDSGFGAMARTRAVIDFESLRSQLADSGFISSDQWEIPSLDQVRAELERLGAAARVAYHRFEQKG